MPKFTSAAGFPNLFSKYINLINWSSVDGFTKVIDSGGSINPRVSTLDFATGTTSGYRAFIYDNSTFLNITSALKPLTFEIPLIVLGYDTLQTIYLHLTYDTSTPPSETANHLGWKIVNNQLYASNGNGTTQTITNTGVILTAGLVRQRLKIVFNPNVSAKFYVNDILKVTHTTNLPTTMNLHLNMGIITNEAADKGFTIGRILIVHNL